MPESALYRRDGVQGSAPPHTHRGSRLLASRRDFAQRDRLTIGAYRSGCLNRAAGVLLQPGEALVFDLIDLIAARQYVLLARLHTRDRAIVVAHFIGTLLHHRVIHLAHAVRDHPGHGLVGGAGGSSKRKHSHENQSLHFSSPLWVRWITLLININFSRTSQGASSQCAGFHHHEKHRHQNQYVNRGRDHAAHNRRRNRFHHVGTHT